MGWLRDLRAVLRAAFRDARFKGFVVTAGSVDVEKQGSSGVYREHVGPYSGEVKQWIEDNGAAVRFER